MSSIERNNNNNNSNENNSQSANTEYHISTPWSAASEGNLPLLQASLEHLNIDPCKAADENGYTLLQAAASYNQPLVINWLLSQAAANVLLEQTDNDGDSALHYASTPQAAELLVQAGISQDKKNNEGRTALEHKIAELVEMFEDDEDANENSREVVRLKEVISYLESLAMDGGRTMSSGEQSPRKMARLNDR